MDLLLFITNTSGTETSNTEWQLVSKLQLKNKTLTSFKNKISISNLTNIKPILLKNTHTQNFCLRLFVTFDFLSRKMNGRAFVVKC